jgi:CheY-like chemotaxis protein
MKLPYRVLVLDDDEHALSGIVELLRDAGHNETGAATYDAAKRLQAVSPFHLIVSDVRLRSFNGLHLVMQTRADHPETAIIIITGYDDPLIDLEASRYHAEHVRHPIRPAEFTERVNAA